MVEECGETRTVGEETACLDRRGHSPEGKNYHRVTALSHSGRQRFRFLSVL